MGKHNLTVLNEFILMGITDLPELQAPFFGLFLIIYMISVVGNLGIIILTKMDFRLQTPMYFFLRHLAITDLGYSTAVGPKMLVNFVVGENTISYCFCAIQLAFFLLFIISELFILSAMSYDRYVAICNPLCYTGVCSVCAMQLAFFIVFITSELFILSTMSYDRYVAICNPLLYTAIMSQRTCWVLVAIPYFYSTLISVPVTIKIFNLSFCGYKVISHFYCDNLFLLSLLCSNTHEIELIILILSAFDLVSSLLIVLVSYLLIFIAILRMNSAVGRHKAFSTCGSHLTMVVVFYGTLIFMYMQPKSSHSFDTDKVASIFYTLVIPMVNPLIYSLRNKDVKHALHRTWKKICNICSAL
nr:olfactory receptor 8K3-like [Loxodonta africana]